MLDVGKTKHGWELFGWEKHGTADNWTGALRRCYADPLRDETISGVAYIFDEALRH